jgi:hypothetical protein
MRAVAHGGAEPRGQEGSHGAQPIETSLHSAGFGKPDDDRDGENDGVRDWARRGKDDVREWARRPGKTGVRD